MRTTIKQLLKDFSVEDILETCELDPIDAIELLITYGALDLDNIVENIGADTDD